MREMGLGRARGRNAVTLAEARDKAAELFKAVRAGRDPLDDKAAAAAQAAAEAQTTTARAVTFRQAAEALLRARNAGWRNAKHAAQWGATLETYAFPHLGDVPVAAVSTEHVMAALEPIWHAKPETASRVRGRIESVLTAATVRGLRTGDNPARWRGHLAEILPTRAKVRAVKHHAALPWREVGAFLRDLREQDGLGARALELAILTAARTGEVLGARWQEVDLAERTWTVPAARMKAGAEHRVPLAAPAVALLAAMAKLRADDDAAGFIFPGAVDGMPLSNMVMAATLRRMKRGDITAHGFRSTFRDWAAEHAGAAREVAEAALAHTVGNKVEASYRRGDLFERRRELMAAWAAWCERPPMPATVLPMARAHRA